MHFVISFFPKSKAKVHQRKQELQNCWEDENFMRYRYWSFLGVDVNSYGCNHASLRVLILKEFPDFVIASERMQRFVLDISKNFKVFTTKTLNMKCCVLSVLYVGFETRVSKFECFKRSNPKFFSTKQTVAQKSVIFSKIAYKSCTIWNVYAAKQKLRPKWECR